MFKVVRESTPVGNHGAEVHPSELAPSNRGCFNPDWGGYEYRQEGIEVTGQKETHSVALGRGLVFSLAPVSLEG